MGAFAAFASYSAAVASCSATVASCSTAAASCSTAAASYSTAAASCEESGVGARFAAELAPAAPIYREVVFANKERLASQVDGAPTV